MHIKRFNEARQYKNGFTHKDSSDRTHNIVNKEMNKDVYNLRKEVMEYVYRAKRLVPNLPRITVRIVNITVEEIAKNDSPVKRNSSFLAFGSLGGNQIWISEHALKEGYNLHEIVFHEILHAAYSVLHNEKSPLMSAYHKKNLSSELIDKLFISHVDAPNASDWDKKYSKLY